MEESLVMDGYCTKTESVIFESKRCKDKLPKSFWETYSSFANTQGGTIVLGFEEEDERLKLTGVDGPDKIVKDLWDLLHDKKKVSTNLLTEKDVKVMEYGGLEYIVVNVPRADRHQRPVYVNDSMDRGTYRRNNEGDYHCSIPEILEMGRDSTDISTDQRLVDEADIRDINKSTLDSYRNHLRSNIPSHPWLKESDEEFLRLIGAADLNEEKFKLTLAGLLMFGNDYKISRMIPGYHLDYRRYVDGDEWVDRINSDSGLWSGNLFDFYIEVSNRLTMANDHPFVLKGDRRVDDTEMMKAQREALLNGIVHADYLGNGGINVILEKDKFTVSNPGNFRIPIAKATKGGYSDARNPMLMKMFTLVGFVERSGSGIYRICRTCNAMGLSVPEIVEQYDPSRVSLTMGIKGAADTESRILQLMINDNRIDIVTIAEKLGVSKSTVSREISRMKDKGRIARVGGTRGHWKIIEPYDSKI